MAISRLCSVPDCGKAARLNRRYCSSHEHRLQRYGDPLGGGPVIGLPSKHLEEVVLPYEGDDCIEWPFTRMKSGYGQVTYKRRKTLVHRLVCEIFNGPAPADKQDAAHTCGNPKCVNPRHIRWATRAENLADRWGHGTIPIGEAHANSKLNKLDVQMIRVLLASGFTQKSIGVRFGISQASVKDILTGKNWGWMPLKLPAALQKTSPAKPSASDVRKSVAGALGGLGR